MTDWARGLDVTVYRPDYTRHGFANDYESCSVTWTDMSTDAGSLVVAEDHPLAKVLLSADQTVVPISVDYQVPAELLQAFRPAEAGPGPFLRWSGRVIGADLERRDGDTGSVSCTLAGEWIWLGSMLAWQVPTGTIDQQSQSEADERTGPADDVAAAYIQAAITRLNVPLRFTDRFTAAAETITLQARMSQLSDLVVDPLVDAGVALRAYLWLPGETQPPGLTLTDPTIVLDAYETTPKPWVRWVDDVGGIENVSLSVKHPTGYRVVVGNGNTGVDRLYVEYVDTDLRDRLGAFGLPETKFVDANDLRIPDELLKAPEGGETAAEEAARLAALAVAVAEMKVVMLERGRLALVEFGPQASVSFTVRDGAPWLFGRDYFLADVVSADIAGVQIFDRVASVTVADTREQGLVVTPVVGRDRTGGDTAEAVILAAVRGIAANIRRRAAGS